MPRAIQIPLPGRGRVERFDWRILWMQMRRRGFSLLPASRVVIGIEPLGHTKHVKLDGTKTAGNVS